MKRRYLALTCALSLACVLTGCWGGDRDDTTPHSTSPVAPTESVAPSHSAAPTETAGTEPSVSPTDNYHADGEGQVDLDGDGDTQDEHSAGETVRDAVDDAGDAVKDTVDEAGRMARDAARDTGRAVERARDALTGQR